jgi:hypothetical protein
VARFTYLGAEELHYTQYTDLSTGKGLTARPGNTYDIDRAAGWLMVTLPPGDGKWGPGPKPVKEPAAAKAPETTTGDAPAEPRDKEGASA